MNSLTASGDEDSTSHADVAVVMINYNGSDDTEKAYRSLHASSYGSWVAVIVDNASSDDSVSRLQSVVRRGTLLESSVNLGFAAGCNLAFDYAIKNGCDYVFLLNNDAYLDEMAMTRLVEASKKLNDSAILGSCVKFAGSEQYQFFGSRTERKTGGPDWFLFPDNAEKLEEELIRSDFIYGAAMLIPTRIISTVGNFDERFFLNFEETDFCYRAKKLDVPCYVVREAVVYHRSGGSLGIYEGPMQAYFLTRNRLLFCEKHSTTRQRLWLIGREIYRTSLQVVGNVFKNKGLAPATKGRLLGLRDYALRRFGDCPAAVRRYHSMMPKSDQSSWQLQPK